MENICWIERKLYRILDKWKILNGNQESENVIYLLLVKQMVYSTESLWKQNPRDVSIIDYDAYKKIMIQTKEFLKDDGTVKSKRGKKWGFH